MDGDKAFWREKQTDWRCHSYSKKKKTLYIKELLWMAMMLQQRRENNVPS